MQIFFIALLCYILYRFIVGFVIPLVSTANRMKKQFKEMSQQQSAFNNPYQNEQPAEPQETHSHSGSTAKTTSGKKGAKEDYIDFEEVPVKK
jgi:hypothetical protein